MKAAICTIHANLSLPLPLPVNSYPAAEMIEWISSSGIAIIRKNRSSETVVWKATLRAAGLIVLEISHSMSSTRTAARAVVEENVSADRCLIVGRIWPPLENGRAYALALRDRASPERNGNSFWRTSVDTKRKVTMKGRDEKTIAVETGILPGTPGLQSSQSSPTGSMGSCDKRSVGVEALYEPHEVTYPWSNISCNLDMSLDIVCDRADSACSAVNAIQRRSETLGPLKALQETLHCVWTI